ncbi:MAG TPA: polysaccharide deacetylase family protein [Bacteroidales bacterium]|nr:polysaccharide deacetylase family protein [Bacteroidales bacterium]
MRTLIYILSFIFLSTTGALQAQSFDIPVFAYHRFGDSRYPSTNVSLSVFESQLKFLADNHYIVLTLGEAVTKWKDGKALPDKAAILTVDDSYLSFYENGWPLLKKYGFPATIFVQTGTIGGIDFISWPQIKEMQKSGIEIGHHSHDHTQFLNLDEKNRITAFRNDLAEASNEFQEHLGAKPNVYCYPYGEWTTDMEQVLREAGFEAATVQKSGVFSQGSNTMAIPRFPMGGPFATLQGFKNKVVMKALEVKETSPASPFFTDNPPTLRLTIKPDEINLKNAQFFVDGTKVEIQKITTNGEQQIVVLQADKKLTQRRTLYTLTAPSTDGSSWHWYSHLWVNPKVAE